MKFKEIDWRAGNYGYYYGYVGPIRLFTLGFGSKGKYDLSSSLPQMNKKKVDSIEDGKEQAVKMLETFIGMISE
jgi:hypothetical protein